MDKQHSVELVNMYYNCVIYYNYYRNYFLYSELQR